MIVVDTNVVSELMRPSPEPIVVDWVLSHRVGELCTTSITLAEIRSGIERLPAGRRRDALRSSAEQAFAAFDKQVLPFDAASAAEYATVVTLRERAGAPIDGFDAQIAAICRARGSGLATRNVKDFRDTRIDVVDPWRVV